MQVSPVGLLVCVAVYGLGWLLGSPLIVGLVASLAFGTTSALTLSAVGGSSPLIYLVFAAALVFSVVADRRFTRRLRAAFHRNWIAWALCAIAVYAAASAYILPRLFAGLTNAFITAREKGVVEVALSPNSGNVTQTGYFVLGTVTALAIFALRHDPRLLPSLGRGFSCWATLVALAGALDLGAKMAGVGDVFDPIRTASFAFLTQDEQAGFYRINGLSSEASGFAASALAALGYSFTMWKHGGRRRFLLLAAALLVLLVLSTSSTAYAGLAGFAAAVCASLAASWVRSRINRDDMLVAGLIGGIGLALLLLVVASPQRLEPAQKLIQISILDKSDSESGRERAHWNQRSLESLADTWGLGVGFGSSRASNWFVAALSQLGILGTALQLAILCPMLRPPGPPASTAADHRTWVLCRALRACGLVCLLSGLISGGSADPGLLFFVALAGYVVCAASLPAGRATARAGRAALPGRGSSIADTGRRAHAPFHAPHAAGPASLG